MRHEQSLATRFTFSYTTHGVILVAKIPTAREGETPSRNQVSKEDWPCGAATHGARRCHTTCSADSRRARGCGLPSPQGERDREGPEVGLCPVPWAGSSAASLPQHHPHAGLPSRPRVSLCGLALQPLPRSTPRPPASPLRPRVDCDPNAVSWLFISCT